MKKEQKKPIRPRQHQNKQPGLETLMKPKPEFEAVSTVGKESGFDH